MHLKRWLTALVLIPLIILVLLKGGRLSFILILLLINGLAQWEFVAFFQPDVDKARKIKVMALGSLLLLSFCLTGPLSQAMPLFVLVGCLFALFLFYLLSYEHIQELAWNLAINTLGLLYIPLLLGLKICGGLGAFAPYEKKTSAGSAHNALCGVCATNFPSDVALPVLVSYL